MLDFLKGVAGLRAAQTLQNFQTNELQFDITILEGRNRVGGRVHSLKLENGKFVDLGASFIHGCHEANPLYVLSKKKHFKIDTTGNGYSSCWALQCNWYETVLCKQKLKQKNGLHSSQLECTHSPKKSPKQRGKSIPIYRIQRAFQVMDLVHEELCKLSFEYVEKNLPDISVEKGMEVVLPKVLATLSSPLSPLEALIVEKYKVLMWGYCGSTSTYSLKIQASIYPEIVENFREQSSKEDSTNQTLVFKQAIQLSETKPEISNDTNKRKNLCVQNKKTSVQLEEKVQSNVRLKKRKTSSSNETPPIKKPKYEKSDIIITSDEESYKDGLVLGGYQNFVIECLTSELKASILLNKQVCKVFHSLEKGAEVHTTDGYVYSSDYVIVTFPLGVLKREYDVETNSGVSFFPSLSSKKREAIKHLGMGVENKIILQFEAPFWKNQPYFQCTDQRFRFINLDYFGVPGVIVVHTSPPFSCQLSSQPHEITIEEVLTVLFLMFGTFDKSKLKFSYITNWDKDPFSFGSYSYFHVDSKLEHISDLQEPESCLLFAGEACSLNNTQCVHGNFFLF